MKLLGFDPASKRNLGWCILEIDGEKATVKCVAGTVVLPDCNDVSEVQYPLFVAVDTMLDQQEPDFVIVEKTSQFSGSFVTGQVSHCMGSIFAACGKNETQVKYVSPTHVKKVITGNGRAKKAQMKKSTIEFLTKLGVRETKYDSEHAYDAAASILCWLVDNGYLEVSENE